MTNYPWRVRAGTILSQAINTLLLGGHPDMSLSSRAWIERDTSPFWRRIYGWADALFGAGHCEDAFEADTQFAFDVLDSANDDS